MSSDERMEAEEGEPMLVIVHCDTVVTSLLVGSVGLNQQWLYALQTGTQHSRDVRVGCRCESTALAMASTCTGRAEATAETKESNNGSSKA